MARTKQTARVGLRENSRRGWPKHPPVFHDHAGQPYSVMGGIVHDLNADPVILKLEIQLYNLSEHNPDLDHLAWNLLYSDAACTIREDQGRRFRIDVYTDAKSSIEECVEHYTREKAYRQAAIQDMENVAMESVQVGSSDDEDDVEAARQEAVHGLSGKESLPHIVPAWCDAIKYVHERDYWSTQRYRSFFLAIPKECRSYDDLRASGIWVVKFDQDWSPVMHTETWDHGPDEDQLVDLECGWVEVEKSSRAPGPPLLATRVCVVQTPRYHIHTCPTTGEQMTVRSVTPACVNNLYEELSVMTSSFGTCDYKELLCEQCDSGIKNHDCETELNNNTEIFSHQDAHLPGLTRGKTSYIP